MTKFVWFRKWFISFGMANELYYTTSKSGSVAYYLFRVGIQKYKRSNESATALIIDIPFLEISIGKLTDG